MGIKLSCKDYGFECGFETTAYDVNSVIDEFSKHMSEIHAIDYSKEALQQFILRKS